MEYCYPDFKRKCQCGGKEEKCAICGKVISDCEYVSNWTTCAECFDKPRTGAPAHAGNAERARDRAETALPNADNFGLDTDPESW